MRLSVEQLDCHASSHVIKRRRPFRARHSAIPQQVLGGVTLSPQAESSAARFAMPFPKPPNRRYATRRAAWLSSYVGKEDSTFHSSNLSVPRWLSVRLQQAHTVVCSRLRLMFIHVSSWSHEANSLLWMSTSPARTVYVTPIKKRSVAPSEFCDRWMAFRGTACAWMELLALSDNMLPVSLGEFQSRVHSSE